MRKKNADVPILYIKNCNNPPTTDRPAAASLMPKETAAPLVLDVLAPLLVVVPVVPSRVVGSAVLEIQSLFPCTTGPLRVFQ